MFQFDFGETGTVFEERKRFPFGHSSLVSHQHHFGLLGGPVHGPRLRQDNRSHVFPDGDELKRRPWRVSENCWMHR